MSDYSWESISAENAASILLALDDEKDYDVQNLPSNSAGDEETIQLSESESVERG